MSKDYQKTTAPVGTDAELVLPEAVTVAMAEIGGAVKEVGGPAFSGQLVSGLIYAACWPL
jgi:hypothetical protein